MIDDDDTGEQLEAHVRTRDAIERLSGLGPVSEIIEHAATEAAYAVRLDRVLLSRIEDGALVVERVAGDGVAEDPITSPLPLAYPLIECEVLRRRRARLVADIDDQPTRYAFLERMRWRTYVTAPILIDGRPVGFFHGDRIVTERPLEAHDAEMLEQFARGFGLVFERAVLRLRLRNQQREIARVANWAEMRSAELSDGAIDLAHDRTREEERRTTAEDSLSAHSPVAELTARELDVLRLLADGRTNGDIARSLVVTEGTVKFHVKNVLRKMQAANRADAVSRYLRLTLGESPTHR